VQSTVGRLPRFGISVAKSVSCGPTHDGRFQVRWRGGEWTDQDGTFRTANKLRAGWAVQELIGDCVDWRRVDQIHRVAGH
jgi:hypothetical protein